MVSGSKGSAQRDPPEGRSVRCRRLSRKVNSFFYTTLASASCSCVAYYTELPILPRRSSPPVRPSPFQEVPAGAAHAAVQERSAAQPSTSSDPSEFMRETLTCDSNCRVPPHSAHARRCGRAWTRLRRCDALELNQRRLKRLQPQRSHASQKAFCGSELTRSCGANSARRGAAGGGGTGAKGEAEGDGYVSEL